MMYNNFLNAAFCLVGLLTFNNMYGITVGSDTAPSRQAFVTFPAADTDNTALGFAVFNQGFFLEDQTTSLTFNDYYPVNYTMGLNGGTCYLAEDLALSSLCDLTSSGTIKGNFHTFSFAQQNQTVPLPYSGQLKLLDSKSLVDRARDVDWSPDDRYILAGDDSYAEIFYWNSVANTLTLTGSVLNGVKKCKWSPQDVAPYYFADLPVFGVRTYSFNAATGAINLIDSKEAGIQCFSLAWANTGTCLAVGRGYVTDNVSVYTVSAGVMTHVCDYDPVSTNVYDLAWDNTGHYLALTTSNKITLLYYDGASLSLVQTIALGGAYSLAWSNDGKYLVVGKNYSTDTLKLYRFDGSSLVAQNWNMISETLYPNTISWASSNDYFSYATTATVLKAMVVDTPKQQLSLSSLQSNAGIVNSVNNNSYLSDLTSIRIATAVSTTISVWGITDYPYTFSNTTIVFNDDVQLRQPLYFSGECSLTTNGKRIDLNNENIVLLPGATLSLHDTEIYGLGGPTTIQFLDNTTTLSLERVNILLTGSYSLQGKWDIIGDVTITGTQIFTYATSQQSTIYAHATLAFDSGMTFSYYPSGAATNLLAMQDMTSQLYLYETTSYIQNAGLVLTYGTLSIDGECPLYAGGGLYLSDGTPAHAVTLNVLPESGMRVMSGSLYD